MNCEQCECSTQHAYAQRAWEGRAVPLQLEVARAGPSVADRRAGNVVHRYKAYFCSEECHDAFQTASALRLAGQPGNRLPEGTVVAWAEYLRWTRGYAAFADPADR